MMRQEPKASLGRRQFFRALGGSTVVAAAAVASPMGASEAQAYDPGNEETKARYRVSDEVRAFYRTNSYETLPNNAYDTLKK